MFLNLDKKKERAELKRTANSETDQKIAEPILKRKMMGRANKAEACTIRITSKSCAQCQLI